MRSSLSVSIDNLDWANEEEIHVLEANKAHVNLKLMKDFGFFLCKFSHQLIHTVVFVETLVMFARERKNFINSFFKRINKVFQINEKEYSYF